MEVSASVGGPHKMLWPAAVCSLPTPTPQHRNMVNDLVEAITAFVAMLETRQIAKPKERNITNIDRKGAASHRKIG